VQTKPKEPAKTVEVKDQGADCHDVDDQHWINGYPTPIAHPMSGYDMYAAQRKSWGINGIHPHTCSHYCITIT
jgi:hypothetical protein